MLTACGCTCTPSAMMEKKGRAANPFAADNIGGILSLIGVRGSRLSVVAEGEVRLVPICRGRWSS